MVHADYRDIRMPYLTIYICSIGTACCMIAFGKQSCRVIYLLLFPAIGDCGSHRLHEYSSETGLAIVIDGNDTLKVSTEHLRDLAFQVGSVYQFIGELLIQPDNEVHTCPGLVKALAHPLLSVNNTVQVS